MLTDAQLEQRRHGLGSSEIAAVCGLSDWRSPLDVWLEKTGRREPFAGNANTELGQLLEPKIARWWADERARRGTPVRNVRRMPTLVDREHEWLLATPDRRANDDDGPIIGEIKWVGEFTGRAKWRDADVLADDVTVQSQIQQRVTGIHRAEVVVWVQGGDPYKRIVPSPYDPKLVDDLIGVAREFWFDFVQADREPPIDASDSWATYLRRKYPSPDAPAALAPAEADALVERYTRAHIDEKKAAARKAEAKHELQQLIGIRAGLFRPGKYSVMWSTAKSGERRFSVRES